MLVTNSSFRAVTSRILDLEFSIKLAHRGVAKPLLLWINDGLMAIFFFLVGLGLKRELAEGHLASMRRAALPAVAAVGGMLVRAVF